MSPPAKFAVPTSKLNRSRLIGGHDVPEDKIRERHRRLRGLVATAMMLADNATVYDNSRRKGPRIAAQLSGGVVSGSPSWPDWTPAALLHHWLD